jgi:hypothetical protein
VLWRGKKIAGAAQRRTRDGLLIQGSVQPPPLSLLRADWQKALCAVAALRGGAEWIEFEPDAGLRDAAAILVSKKYAQDGYHRKR